MTKIKTLINRETGEKYSPRTHVNAVYDDNGNTLDSLLGVQDEKLTELDSVDFGVAARKHSQHAFRYIDGSNAFRISIFVEYRTLSVTAYRAHYVDKCNEYDA